MPVSIHHKLMNWKAIYKYLIAFHVIIIYLVPSPLSSILRWLCRTFLELLHGNSWVNHNGNVFAYIKMHLWINFHRYFMYKLYVKYSRSIYISSIRQSWPPPLKPHDRSRFCSKSKYHEKRLNIYILISSSSIYDVY